MKIPGTVAFLITLSAAAMAQAEDTATEADVFREYVESDGVETVWQKEAGRVESSDSNVVVSAFSATSSSHKISAMRGVRLDISNREGVSKVVYVPENYVEKLAGTIARLELELAHSESRRSKRGEPRTHGCQGAAEFSANPQPPYELFRIDYCWGGRGPGFVLVTPAGKWREFEFPGYRPVEFSRILDSAMAALEAKR